MSLGAPNRYRWRQFCLAQSATRGWQVIVGRKRAGPDGYRRAQRREIERKAGAMRCDNGAEDVLGADLDASREALGIPTWCSIAIRAGRQLQRKRCPSMPIPFSRPPCGCYEFFSSPYTVAANQPIGAVLRPGDSNISTDFKTLNSATHRITDPWGTTGYGISRASGAFANANSSLDHYFVGLIVSAFNGAGSPSFSATIF